MKFNINKDICYLCYNHNSELQLCIQNNYNLLKNFKEFQFIIEEFNPYSYISLCNICGMKLKVYLKGEIKICDMQKPSQNLNTNCECDRCKAKFGNLPLLAEVIEKLESDSKQSSKSREISSEERTISTEQCTPLNYTKKNLSSLSADINQPSTSKDKSDNRKIMNCEHCGKSFTHKGDMKKHLRKHTGEQPFMCTICKRKFAHTSNLARHLKVHSGDKPFLCKRCNKSFSRKDKLLLHQQTKLCQNFLNDS